MIKKQLLLMAIFASILGYVASAHAIEGYPGSTWGEIRQDLPNKKGPDGPTNVIGQGYIEQGIDWVRWGNLFFNSYGTVRYKFDTMHYDWNNSVGPGLGIALTHYTKNGNQVRLGIEHNWENYFNTGRVEEKTMLYIRWFQSWNFKN